MLAEPAEGDAALDAELTFFGGLLGEDALEQEAGCDLVASGPGEVILDMSAGVGQPEGVEVPLDSSEGVSRGS